MAMVRVNNFPAISQAFWSPLPSRRRPCFRVKQDSMPRAGWWLGCILFCVVAPVAIKTLLFFSWSGSVFD
jgi:hypothetical protein